MKIAIAGTAPGSAGDVPWEDKQWEIWGLAWRAYPRVDLLFEIHPPKTWGPSHGDGYRESLKRSQIPIYFREKHPDIPKGARYPIEDVRADLCPEDGGADADFFTSSLAFMMALAIVQKPEEIALYGCDLLTGGEYEYQRPAMEYLVGLARGRGIKVFIPKRSALCKANFVYGEHDGAGVFAKANCITEEILQERLKKYREDKAQTQARLTELTNREVGRLNALDGAIDESSSLLELVQHFNRGGVVP